MRITFQKKRLISGMDSPSEKDYTTFSRSKKQALKDLRGLKDLGGLPSHSWNPVLYNS
jgi:hypothetical protein